MSPENKKHNPQNQPPKPAPEAQQDGEKLSTAQKYIKLGKLYERLERIDEERQAVMNEIKQVRGS